MRRSALWLLVTMVTISIAAGAAFAANVHLKGGPRAEPAFTDNGLTLTATASVSGLGNADVLISITATADPTASCTNPAGQTQPPGQNPAEVVVTGSISIPASDITNGNLTFSVVTQPPVTPIPGAPDCPGVRWTEAITDMAFTSAIITVDQGGAPVELTVSCGIDPETEDGSVGGGDVTCTSS